MQPRVRSILESENIRIPSPFLHAILESCRGDMRQVLNVLQLWRNSESLFSQDNHPSEHKSQHSDSTASFCGIHKTEKDVSLGAFEVVPKLFAREGTMEERIGHYFVDSSMVPLLVQVQSI